MSEPVLVATVSGSFHRHLRAIDEAVKELVQRGVYVASPSDPRVVDNIGEFLFVASDRVRSVRMVQDRHLESIGNSAFVWLASPDGYVGQSAAMEIGFAIARRIPVYAEALPLDLTLRQYVRKATLTAVVEHHLAQNHRAKTPTFLIDPYASIETAHTMLERIAEALQKPATQISESEAQLIQQDRQRVASAFQPLDSGFPGLVS